MFDDIPVRVWFLIAIAVLAYPPALYVYRHIAHSPSRRDITQLPEDLSWRTAGQFARSLAILAALTGLAVFIFTETAQQFAASPQFLPWLIAGLGAWSLLTAPIGLVTGRIQPFVRGFNNTYHRDGQPKRYWASLVWNATLGALLISVAFVSYEDAAAQRLEEQCYDEKTTSSPEVILGACNQLIANSEGAGDSLSDYVAWRGIAYHRLGDYRRALEDYDEALRLDPRDSYSFYNRALIYQQLGDGRRAAANLTAAIRLRPTDADLYLERGLIFLDTGRFDEAVTDFSRVHELDPKNRWALANRGMTYAWMKDRARAERDFSKVRTVDPTNPVLLRGEALLSMSAGDMTTAVSRLTAALDQDPNDEWSLSRRIDAYQQLGEDEKAEADSRKLRQLRERER